MAEARRQWQRVGLLRLATLWPFPAEAVARWSASARRVIVAEMNRGQVLREVQRVVPEASGYQRTDGEVIQPEELVAALEEAAR